MGKQGFFKDKPWDKAWANQKYHHLNKDKLESVWISLIIEN